MLNADSSPYDLTNKTVTFNDHKENDKYVVDNKVTVVDARNGSISYTLHDQVFASTGVAWFEIIDSSGNKVDSTQNFNLDVENAANASVYNTNYINQLDDLREQMQHIVDSADTQNKAQLTKAQSDLNAKLDSMQQAYNTMQAQQQASYKSAEDTRNTQWAGDKQRIDNEWSTDKTRIDNEAKSQKDVINNDYQSAKSAINSDWNTDKQRIDGEWTTQKAGIQDSANTQINAIKSSADTAKNDWSSDKQRIDNEWSTTKTSLDSQLASLKSQLDGIQNTTNTLKSTDIPDLSSKADAVQAKVTQLQNSLGNINWSSYVKSVNGVRPDSNGNAQIPVSWNNLADKPWFNYSLYNGDIHFNTSNGNFEWFTKNYTSNAVQNGGTMAIDLDDDGALVETAAELTKMRYFPQVRRNLNSSDDANKITESGYYKIVTPEERPANVPDDAQFCFLKVHNFDNGDVQQFIILPYDSDPNERKNIYYRTIAPRDNKYPAWRRLLNNDDRTELEQQIANAGKVKTVNGIQPDAGGNITISGLTKSVQINGQTYNPGSDGKLTIPMYFLSGIDVVSGYNIATNQATTTTGGQNVSNNGHNSGWLVDSRALPPFAQAINNLTGRIDALEHQPVRGITDVDGTHHDVKFLSQSDYNALSTKDPNTLYITPES